MMIWLVASKKNIPSVVKVFLYFLYLIILLAQAILNWQPLEYKETCLSLSKCFFLGIYYSFYAAHLIFLGWTSIIIRTLWPHFDVEYATKMIKPFFFDDQISLLPFLVFVSSTCSIVYLLYHYEVPQANIWANLMIILLVQVLFNPYIKSWFVERLRQAVG